jgi:hypothetical protein
MARLKGDGKGRMGGRLAGTPNKVTTDLKAWVASILDDGRKQFVSDMGNLEPAERVRVYTNLMNYVLPKQQAMNVEAQTEAEYKALERLINTAPDEFVDRIAEKVIKMKEENEKQRIFIK